LSASTKRCASDSLDSLIGTKNCFETIYMHCKWKKVKLFLNLHSPQVEKDEAFLNLHSLQVEKDEALFELAFTAGRKR
jgi:hypothetical protein